MHTLVFVVAAQVVGLVCVVCLSAHVCAGGADKCVHLKYGYVW